MERTRFTQVLAVCLLPLLGVAASGAQTETPPPGGSCPEMLELLGVPQTGQAHSDVAAMCERTVNVQILLNASSFTTARGRAAAVCVPAETELTLQRVAEIFYSHAVQYREASYEDPFVRLIEALEQEYPCGNASERVAAAD